MRARTRGALAGASLVVLALVIAITERTKSRERERDAASRAPESLSALHAFAELPASFMRAPEHHQTGEAVASAPVPGYVPAGLPPDFRERIVRDFADHVEARLGPNALTAEQRDAIARAQHEFWDEHGPNVDEFTTGNITQLELASRTRLAMKHFADRVADTLSDAEYFALFDMTKGDDLYGAMFHSADEQPGLPMKPTEAADDERADRAPPPLGPAHATEQRIPGDRAPIPKKRAEGARRSDRIP